MVWMFVMAFVIILMSFLCGFLVFDLIDHKADNHYFASPLGLVILLGLLQIVYYPIQLYNLPTKYIYLSTFGLFGVIGILSLFKFKKLIKFIKGLKRLYKEILFGLLMFGVFCFIYYYVIFPTRTDDLYFYFPYILEKVKSVNLTATMYGQYDFQGFYDFIAMWVWVYQKLVSAGLAVEILPVAVVSWVISIVLFWGLSFTIVDTMCFVRDKISKKWISFSVSFIVFIYTIGAYWYLQTPYLGNSFRRISIVIILFLILSLLEEFNYKKFIILEISFISIISQTSTGLFFVIFILYAMLFYYASKNEKGYLTKIVLLSIGPMFFASCFVVYVMLFVNYLYGVYALVVLFKLDKYIEWFLNKTWRVLMIIVPLFFGIWTRLPSFVMPTFNISYFDIQPNFFDRHAFEGIENLFEFGFNSIPEVITSLFCIFVWICFIYYLFKNIKEDRPEDFLSFHIITMFVTFFNPWVITFVMTYMTNVVYFRIYDLFFNILTIILIMSYCFDSLNKQKAIIAIILMFILFTNEVPKNQTWMLMGFKEETYNPLYHLKQLEIDVLSKFEKEILNGRSETTIIASQIYSSEAFTNANIKNVKDNLYKYGDDPSEEAEFQRIFYRQQPGLEVVKGDYLKACELAQKRNVEFVIIEAQFNPDLEDGIGYCGQKVLEVENYRIFEMHYDWLEWSMGK